MLLSSFWKNILFTSTFNLRDITSKFVLEQVKSFTFLGCIISYKEGKDLQCKITRFLQTLGRLYNAFKWI
jgi:hypothetical protein